MIIGRAPAPSGAIKIKKNEEGVPRVVSCGCCCACESIPLSSLDPTFAKRLSGDDPDVTPFTQVSFDYEVEGYANVGWYGNFPSVAWVDGDDCGLKKYADWVIPPTDIDPSYDDRYDSFVGCGIWARGAIGGGGETTFVVRLTKGNCLEVGMYGNIWSGGIVIGEPSGACEEFVSSLTNRGYTITENYRDITGFGATSFLYKGPNQYWPSATFSVGFYL